MASFVEIKSVDSGSCEDLEGNEFEPQDNAVARARKAGSRSGLFTV
jgi:hypothetical protein